MLLCYLAECCWSERIASESTGQHPPDLFCGSAFTFVKTSRSRIHTPMRSFGFWLLLREQLDKGAYNDLFRQELERLLPRLSDPLQHQHAKAMLDFDWTRYMAGAIRRSGITSQDEIDEKVHEIVIRMLVSPGGLFKDYDERKHGPFDLRFKRTLANSLKNLTEKERNRRRYIPSVPIRQEFVPGGVTADDLAARGTPESDPAVIDNFRELIGRQLGTLAVRVFDARLEGVEMKNLPGVSAYAIKKTVQDIKSLARTYATALGDPSFTTQVERLMAAEERTFQRRRATAKQRMVTSG
jgi:hypothetical protein